MAPHVSSGPTAAAGAGASGKSFSPTLLPPRDPWLHYIHTYTHTHAYTRSEDLPSRLDADLMRNIMAPRSRMLHIFAQDMRSRLPRVELTIARTQLLFNRLPRVRHPLLPCAARGAACRPHMRGARRHAHRVSPARAGAAFVHAPRLRCS